MKRPVAACVALGTVLLGLLSGCAPRTAPPGPVAFPVEDDYERPSVAGLDPRDASILEEAWVAIGVGDTEGAIRRLSEALRKRPDALGFRAALGYAWLRAGRVEDAKAEFDAVLGMDPAHRSALVGAATTSRRLGRNDEALALYRRAREGVDNEILDRRILELSAVQADTLVSNARRLRSEGRLEQALDAYARAMEAAPALGGLRIEWADVLFDLRRFDEAVRLLEASDPADRGSRLHLARILAEEGNIVGAIGTLEALRAALPDDPEVRDRLAELQRTRIEAALPDQVRDIAGAQWATRADLAALLIATVPQMQSAQKEVPPVVTDIEGLWGREYILAALSLGLMETYPNHTFQPEATIRRGDLGHALGRALERSGIPPGPAVSMTDVTANNRLHPEIARAVSCGVLSLTPNGAFEPWRPVTGAEAVRAVGALTALLRGQ